MKWGHSPTVYSQNVPALNQATEICNFTSAGDICSWNPESFYVLKVGLFLRDYYLRFIYSAWSLNRLKIFYISNAILWAQKISPRLVVLSRMGIFGVIYGGPEVLFSTAHNCQTMPLGYNWTYWSDSHCSSGLFLCLKESTVSSKIIIIIKWTVTGHCAPDFSSSCWNLNTFHYNAVLFFFAPQMQLFFPSWFQSSQFALTQTVVWPFNIPSPYSQ